MNLLAYLKYAALHTESYYILDGLFVDNCYKMYDLGGIAVEKKWCCYTEGGGLFIRISSPSDIR